MAMLPDRNLIRFHRLLEELQQLVPLGQNEYSIEGNRELIARAEKGIKVKAELLVKASPQPLQHSEALNFMASALGFRGGYHFFRKASKEDSALPMPIPPGNRMGYQLAVLNAPPEVLDCYPAVTTWLTQLAQIINESSGDEMGTFFVSAIFYKNRYPGQASSGVTPEAIESHITKYTGIKPLDMVCMLLNFDPVKDGKRQSWDAMGLADSTVEELLEMPMAQPEEQTGFNRLGWEHVVAILANHFFDAHRLKQQNGLMVFPRGAGTREINPPPPMDLVAFANMKQYVYKALAPFKGRPLKDLLQVEPDFHDLYLCQEERLNERGAIQLLYRNEMLGVPWKLLEQVSLAEGLSLSIYRVRPPFEDGASGKDYRICGVLENDRKELVGGVELMHMLSEGSSLEDWAHFLDDVGDRRAYAAGLTAMRMIEEDELGMDGAWARTLIVDNWSIHPSLRGKGIGLEMLKAVVKRGLYKLPQPRLVLSRIWPAQLVQGARRADKSLSCVQKPFEAIDGYWRSTVWKSVFPSVKNVGKLDYSFMSRPGTGNDMDAYVSILSEARRIDAWYGYDGDIEG